MKVQSEESLDELSSESGTIYDQEFENQHYFRELGIGRQQSTNVRAESWRQTRSSEKSQIALKVKVSTENSPLLVTPILGSRKKSPLKRLVKVAL